MRKLIELLATCTQNWAICYERIYFVYVFIAIIRVDKPHYILLLWNIWTLTQLGLIFGLSIYSSCSLASLVLCLIEKKNNSTFFIQTLCPCHMAKNFFRGLFPKIIFLKKNTSLSPYSIKHRHINHEAGENNKL